MAKSDLSSSQKALLLDVEAAPDGLVVENRSTAASSLARKGLVTKALSYRALSTGGRAGGRTAELKLTDAGRDYLKAHGNVPLLGA